MSTTKKKNIRYGNVEIGPEEFHPKNVKVRISIMIDEDILLAFKAAADDRSIGYQTLMNQKLRDCMGDIGRSIEDRLSALEAARNKRG